MAKKPHPAPLLKPPTRYAPRGHRRAQCNLRLRPDVLARLKAIAARNGRSVNMEIEAAVDGGVIR